MIPVKTVNGGLPQSYHVCYLYVQSSERSSIRPRILFVHTVVGVLIIEASLLHRCIVSDSHSHIV